MVVTVLLLLYNKGVTYLSPKLEAYGSTQKGMNRV